MDQTEITREALLTEMHQINEHWRKSLEDAKEAGETEEQSTEITAEANSLAKRSNDITETSKTIEWWALVVSG